MTTFNAEVSDRKAARYDDPKQSIANVSFWPSADMLQR